MYIRAEEILLPLRFFFQTIHFIAVLTVLWDLDYVVGNTNKVQANTASDSIALNHFDQDKGAMAGISYASIACFAVEYVTLFFGVSMFNRPVQLLNIVLHFVGVILTVLFMTDVWSLAAYYAFFALFSAVPALVEILYFLLVSWLRSFKI